MKLNKKKIPARAQKPPAAADEITPAQIAARKNQQEWDKLTKFPEYFAKSKELRESGVHQEKICFQATNIIHNIMWQEEWFAENTPYPFKIIHWSRIASDAQMICRYLIQSALADNQDSIRTLARITVELTETLMELLNGETEAAKKNRELIDDLNRRGVCDGRKTESNAELMQSTAEKLPYWPMLRFLNTAANSKKQFRRIAQELKLGSDCPINVSESANYSLETPINYFVWKCLRHFQDVHWHIRHDFKNPGYGHVDRPAKTFEEAVEGIIFQKLEPPHVIRPMTVGMIKREDIQIYKASYELQPLTKSTAEDWADKAIVPYVCSKYTDFHNVPEFSNIFKRSGVKTRGQQRAQIRKDIIRSLVSMARPASIA